MKERKSFETRVLVFLVVIVVLQVTILFKQYQVEDRVIQSLHGLYYDIRQLIGE
jgi:hypothetical protein